MPSNNQEKLVSSLYLAGVAQLVGNLSLNRMTGVQISPPAPNNLKKGLSMEEERMSLSNIRDGAAVEMFDRCLKEALDNINDINTNLKQRVITLKVSIKPSDDRTFIAIGLTCDAKLQGQEPQTLTADLKIDASRGGFAIERDQTTKQTHLPFSKPIAITK